MPNIVDNITSPEDIANVFAHVYESVFSSASTSHDQLKSIVLLRICQINIIYMITCMEVTKAVQMLKSRKWNDDHSISSDLFINAPDSFI